MPSSTRRTVTAIVVASCVAMALVLGLWQRVDHACRADEATRADPLDGCTTVRVADVEVGPFQPEAAVAER